MIACFPLSFGGKVMRGLSASLQEHTDVLAEQPRGAKGQKCWGQVPPPQSCTQNLGHFSQSQSPPPPFPRHGSLPWALCCKVRLNTAHKNFISLHRWKGELTDDRSSFNTYVVELQHWWLEQGASLTKPGYGSSLVGLHQVVMRSFTARMRKLQLAGLAPHPGIQFFSLNPKYNDLFSAPPRLTWIPGEASHPEVVISQLDLSRRCWSRTKVGKSQQRIGKKGWECPNLTCDFRPWLSMVTPLPGFSCVLRKDAVVHSGA